MNDKENKPFGFRLFSSDKTKSSVVVFVIVLIFWMGVQVVARVSEEVKDRRSRPAIAMDMLARDIKEFISLEKRYPKGFIELEKRIWTDDQKARSVLSHGDQLLVFRNYEYVYYSGKVKGISVVYLWAMPLGKYRDHYKTYLAVIAKDSEQLWRGVALNEKQREFVLKDGFNPSFADMANLNMKRDGSGEPGKKKKKNMFGF